jgi:hypothetical protein
MFASGELTCSSKFCRDEDAVQEMEDFSGEHKSCGGRANRTGQ